MDPEKIVVVQEDITFEQASYIERYFLRPYQNPDRKHLMFAQLEGEYDPQTERMRVSAELRADVSAVIGEAAIESAFLFAKDMLQLPGQQSK